MSDDLISRKAAIGELTENKEMINAVLDSLTLDYNTRRNQEQRRGQINEDIETIKALPSAQPERETAKFIRWMECKRTADYISYTPHCKCSKCGTEFLIETIKYCYMCGARMKR